MSDPRNMARLDPEERDALRLEPDSQLTAIDSNTDFAEMANRSERHPFASCSHEQLAHTLKTEQTHLIPARLPRLEQILPGIHISRWARDPSVAVLSMKNLGDTASYGRCSWLDRTTLLLDARIHPAYVVSTSNGREWILRFLDGELTLFGDTSAKQAFQPSERKNSRTRDQRWPQTAVANNLSSTEQEREPIADIAKSLQRFASSEQRLLGIRHALLRLVERLTAPEDLPPTKSAPTGVALSDHDELFKLFTHRRESVQAKLASLEKRYPEAKFEYWKHDARIVFLTGCRSVGKSLIALSGLWRWVDDHVAMLDSRRRPVYLQGQHNGLDWVLRCANGTLEIFESSENNSGTGMNGPDEQRNCSMNGLTPEELDILGLARDTELEPMERIAISGGLKAISDSSLPELPSTQPRWDELLAHDTEQIPHAFESLKPILRDWMLSRWRKDARVLLLEAKNASTELHLAGASSWISHGIALLDARERPAYIHGLWNHVAWVLRLSPEELILFVETQMPVGPNQAAARPPDLPTPDIDTFIGQTAVQPWLRSLAKTLASSSRPFRRVAAAGVLARLWAAPDKAGREQNRKWLDAGNLNPTSTTLRWFSELGLERWESIESSALYEWHELENSFEELIETALEDPDSLETCGRTWLHRRDDLESVLFLLLRVDAGTALARGIAKFDERASRHRELWRLMDLRDDERLRAVSWQHPGDWWGELVLEQKP